MLNLDILSDGIPALHLEDTVLLAKEIMMDHHVAHLPVVSENKLLGCISEDNLLDAPSDEAPISSLQAFFSHASVQGVGHMLDTLHICSEFQLTLIPVLERGIRIIWVQSRHWIYYVIQIKLSVPVIREPSSYWKWKG